MITFPAALNEPVKAVLRGLGDLTAIRSAQLLGGGCINHAMRLDTEQSVYLLKWNANAPYGMFQSELQGLDLLASTHTVRVPQVFGTNEAEKECPAFILMEWLEGTHQGDPAKLGEQLAEMHRRGVSPQTPLAYGLGEDNYIGSTRQINGWETDWAVFFGQSRLRPQLELAVKGGRMPNQRRARLEQLIERLPQTLVGVKRRPSLIHGDLWGGNVIPSADGLALIDPAVSYSDREAEIAYTELFGGFSPRFYAAYQSAWPLDPDYAERRDLYNLYHLLNHLNLFGESYGFQVDQVLQWYAREPKHGGNQER